REHHASHLIQTVHFVLDPSRCLFRTACPFTASLRICGAEVHAGMEFAQFARLSPVRFQPHLGHAWYADGELLSIQFEIYRPAKAVTSEVISLVVASFVGAHRLPPGKKTKG